MVRSRILAVSSAFFSNLDEPLAKSTTFAVMEGDVTTHPSLDFVLNITEVTQVCMDLEPKVLKKDMKPAKNSC
jgi:hypothetical protein